MKLNKFYFKPTKLIAVKEKIKKTFPTKADIYNIKSEKAKKINLKELLEKISEFSLNKIIYLADSLKKAEITALANNYSEISAELYQKINKIILHRKDKFLIELLWHNFADDYQNQDLRRLLGNLLALFSQLNEQEKILENIFNNSSPLLNMQKYIKDEEISLFKFLDQVDLIFENRISKKLAAELFTKASKDFFIRENAKNLIKIFSEFKSEDFKKAAENYLLIFNEDEYFEEMMYKIKDRLGDPREDYSTAWNGINKKVKNKAKNWLNHRKLKEFFDSITTDQEEAKRRFAYWEKHYKEMKKVDYVEKYLQLFMIFDKFAVVEFGDLGNAAYFYEKELFNKELAQYMNKYNMRSNRYLKYTTEAGEETNKKVEKVNHYKHEDYDKSWRADADKMIKLFKSGRR